MKLIFLFAFLLVANVGADTCAERLQPYWTICNRQQESLSRGGPATPVKRGKMGPRGEKGERGNPGERGPDLSVEVESLEGKSLRLEEENSLLNLNLLELNRTLSGQSRKIESLEKEKSNNFC